MNSNYHVDMKYSIPKPKSDIKPHSKVKDFIVMTAATAVMACGIYFFKFANNFAFGDSRIFSPRSVMPLRA